MKKEKRYWFAARAEAIEQMSSHELMDMLRYDAVRVEYNPPQGMYLMSKPQEGGYPPPTEARWASFQVRIHVIAISREVPAREEIERVVTSEEAILAARKGAARG